MPLKSFNTNVTLLNVDYLNDDGEIACYQGIRSSDNDSTGFWAPGSLHTLGADGHI